MPTDNNLATTCLLIVEKDPAIRHALAAYLRDCGYRVIEAIDTDEAVTLLGHDDPPVTIVLCEVEARGQRDGFGLAHWVRQNRPGTRMILAGTATREAEKAGDLCAESPLLEKPYDHKQLLDRIKWLTAARDRNSDGGPA